MRTWFIAGAPLALIGCGSTAEAPETEPSGAATAVIDASTVVLEADGIEVGGERLFFKAGQNEAIALVAKVLGDPESTGANAECGAGPMEMAEFANGLTLNFQDGALVGWITSQEHEKIAQAGEIQLGAARSVLETSDFVTWERDSTLGDEFTAGDNVGGFIEEDKVSMLYAGTQCFFR